MKKKKNKMKKIPKNYLMALLVFLGVFIVVVTISLVVSNMGVSKFLKTEIANFPGGPLCITNNGDCFTQHNTTVNLAQTGRYRVEVDSVRGYPSTAQACQHTCQTNEEFDVYVDGQLLGRATDNGPGCPNGMMPAAGCIHDNGERTTTDHHVLGEFDFTAGAHNVSAIHPLGTGNNSTGSVDAGAVTFTFIGGVIPPKDCYYNVSHNNQYDPNATWYYDMAAGTCNSGQDCNRSAYKLNDNVSSAQECINWCSGQELGAFRETAACQYWGGNSCAMMPAGIPGGWAGVQMMYMEYTSCDCNADCSANGSNGECESGLTCTGGVCVNSECPNDNPNDCECDPTTVGCNQGCDANNVCSSGLTCTGGVCVNSECPNDNPNDCECDPTTVGCNQGCDANNVCSSGLTCTGGVCVNSECPNDNPNDCECDPTTVGCNQGCDANNVCSSGLTCTGGVCVNSECPNDNPNDCECDPTTVGCYESCGDGEVDDDDDCEGDLNCEDGVCVNSDCDHNDDCICNNSIQIVKTAEQTSVAPGTTVDYTFEVTNTGDQALTNVIVTDPLISDISCPQTTLEVTCNSNGCTGESMTCTGSMVITEDTTNTATATGTDPDGNDVTDSDDAVVVVVDQPSSILIEKSVSDNSVNPGDEVTYSYVVTNTGQDTIIDVIVLDSELGIITCPQTTLIAGESMTCTQETIAITEDVTNLVIVTGEDEEGNPVTDDDEETVVVVDQPSEILIEKSVSDNSVNPGDEVTYSYVVTNTGQDTIINISVADNELGIITCPQTTLTAGESMTCTQETITITEDTINVVIVTGEDEEGNEVEDTDAEIVVVEDLPSSLLIEKSVSDNSVNPGDEVTYSYVVTNTGQDTIINISAADNELGIITCPQTTLIAGESMTCTQETIAITEDTTNVVIVTGEDEEGNDVTDDDTITVNVEDVDCNDECVNDSNCSGDLVCSDDGRCRNDNCEDESDCECDCNDDCDSDDDCDGGLECEDGRCRNPECDEESDCECDCNDHCEHNSDCEDDLICDDGRCRNEDCEDEKDCICKVTPKTGLGTSVAIIFSISVAITAGILLILHKLGKFTI